MATDYDDAQAWRDAVIGPPETFGQRLQRLRLERGLTQRALADLSGGKGVTYAYISRLESGQRSPSLEAVRKLATGLQVNPVYLETGQMNTCPHCGRSLVGEYLP